MKRRKLTFICFLALLVSCGSPPKQQTDFMTATQKIVTASPLPTETSTPSPTNTIRPTTTPTITHTPIPPLPPLYVDGPYIKRSDTGEPVWLKGLNVPDIWSNNYSFEEILEKKGLKKVILERWGVNLLRVAIDPETVEYRLPQLVKLIDFAEENGIYCILTPFPSIDNSLRDSEHLPIPDDLVVKTMGFLADKFKDKLNVLYSLWNEPSPGGLNSEYTASWQQWMDSGVKVGQAIRDKNPSSIIVVPGGRLWARDLSYYQDHPFPFENVIYEVHDYWQHPYWQRPNSPSYYDRAMWTWVIGKYPLLIGEFGGACCPNSDPPLQSDHDINYMKEVLQIVNENQDFVHYTMWELETFNDMGIFNTNLELTRRGFILRNDLLFNPGTRFR